MPSAEAVRAARSALRVHVGATSPGVTCSFAPNGTWLEHDAAPESTADYGVPLPSVHVRYAITPDTNLRVAVTRSLARPNYYDTVPYRAQDDSAARSRSATRICSRPPRGTSTCMGEHYFKSVGVVSAGVFYKQLAGLHLRLHLRRHHQRLDLPRHPAAERRRRRPSTGVELALQNQLTFLPAPLRGIGVYANYTFTDSTAAIPAARRQPRCPASRSTSATSPSRTSASASPAACRSTSTARTSIRSAPATGSIASTIRRRQLDFSLSQKLTRNLRLYLDGLNLNDALLRYYQGVPEPSAPGRALPVVDELRRQGRLLDRVGCRVLPRDARRRRRRRRRASPPRAGASHRRAAARSRRSGDLGRTAPIPSRSLIVGTMKVAAPDGGLAVFGARRQAAPAPHGRRSPEQRGRRVRPAARRRADRHRRPDRAAGPPAARLCDRARRQRPARRVGRLADDGPRRRAGRRRRADGHRPLSASADGADLRHRRAEGGAEDELSLAVPLARRWHGAGRRDVRAPVRRLQRRPRRSRPWPWTTSWATSTTRTKTPASTSGRPIRMRPARDRELALFATTGYLGDREGIGIYDAAGRHGLHRLASISCRARASSTSTAARASPAVRTITPQELADVHRRRGRDRRARRHVRSARSASFPEGCWSR